MRHRIYKYKLFILFILFIVCVLVWLIVRAMPATEDDLRRSACFVNGRNYLCLVSGNDTIVLSADSVEQQGVWINRHWWWPSCDGRVLTVRQSGDIIERAHLDNADTLKAFISEGADSLSRLLQRKETERKELQYYLRSHGVIDEGYTQIAAYASKQTVETDSLKRRVERLLAVINKTNDTKKGVHWKLLSKGEYKVSWYDGDDSLETVNCKPIIMTLRHDGSPIIVHTKRRIKPWGVYAVRNVPWGVAEHKKIITVRLSAADTITPRHAILVTGNYWRGHNHDLPQLFALDGAPVFTQHGRFIGIISGKEVRQ